MVLLQSSPSCNRNFLVRPFVVLGLLSSLVLEPRILFSRTRTRTRTIGARSTRCLDRSQPITEQYGRVTLLLTTAAFVRGRIRTDRACRWLSTIRTCSITPSSRTHSKRGRDQNQGRPGQPRSSSFAGQPLHVRSGCAAGLSGSGNLVRESRRPGQCRSRERAGRVM